MKLYLYDTRARQKREFIPLEEGKVGMYHCGPTVYQRPHIGNYRAFLFADLLRRVFEVLGYEVKQIMNLTTGRYNFLIHFLPLYKNRFRAIRQQ